MEYNIYRQLIHILSYRKDLINIINPFLQSLNKKESSDEQLNSFLKTLSRYMLDVLQQTGNIEEEKIRPISEMKSETFLYFFTNDQNIEEILDDICINDKLEEMQQLVRCVEFQSISSIIRSFNEVERLKMPILSYCIKTNAIKCFKFLLINGIGDPFQLCEEQNPNSENHFYCWKSYHRYEWDSMAIAIYLGDTEIINILDERGITRWRNSLSLNAAIVSYRNSLAQEIISEIQKNNKEILELSLNHAIFAASKANNIKGGEVLIKEKANVNSLDNLFENILLLI